MKKYLSSLLIPLTGLSLMLSAAAPVSAQTETAPAFCYTFKQNLGEGRPLSSADAQALTVALSNAGVWNQESSITTYNDTVASAVSGFQEKYAAQILTPNGLSYGTGFVGASTRAELNSLYGGCSTPTQPVQPTQCPAGYTCAPINQNPAPVCPIGWTCTPTTPTQPVNPTNPYLSISSISPAPTSLPVGQSGYWVVNSTDTQSNYGGVTYSANWGDQNVTPSQTTNSFTHSYSNPGLYTITFTVTEVNTGLSVQSSVTVNVGGSNPVNTPATLSTDPSSPATNSVSVTNTTNGTYLGLPLLVFDLTPGNASANLKSLSVQILTPPPYGSQNVPALYLYQGSNLISSTAVSGSVATFNNINLNLQANVYMPLTIKADVAGLSQGELTTITANILSPEVSLQNSAGMIVPVTGSANGNTITVTNGSPISTSGASATLSLDASTPQTQSVTVTNITQGQYLGLPVLVFDVMNKSASMPITLSSITAQINPSGNGSVAAAYLYSGGNLVSSAAVQNGIAQFTNIQYSNMTVQPNVTLPLTIKVDVSGVTSGSEMVSAGIDSTGISSVQNVPVSGGAHGSLITVISNGTSANSSATLSLDPSSPLNNTVRVTDTTNEQYLGLPVLVFDVKPQGTTAYLKNVTAIFVPPTCGSCSGGMNLAAAYLYQGSTQVASASVSGGVATFNNINGISLQPNLYTPFTIKVDVTSVNSSGTKFVSSIGSGGGSGSITLQDASGNNIPVSGTAIGNQITVTQ